MTQVLCEQIHLAHDAPEQTFTHGAGGQVVIADLETVEHVIVQLNGIVPAFEQILRGEPLVNAVKVFQRVGCVVFDFVDILVEECLTGCFKHVEYQDGMVCRKCTARFCDDVRVSDAAVFASFEHGVHHVVRVFLNGVVHRACVGTAGAVVIHAETAAYVHEFKAHAHLLNLHVELRDFAKAALDVTNVGNLATQVEVDELHAVFHLLLLDVVQCFQQFGTVQAELAVVSAGFFPLAATGAGKLDADADIRTHADATGQFYHQVEFVHLLDDDENLLAHLLCKQREFDKVFVLVAVADNQRIWIVHVRKNSMQFRLGTGFETDVVLFSVADDFF